MHMHSTAITEDTFFFFSARGRTKVFARQHHPTMRRRHRSFRISLYGRARARQDAKHQQKLSSGSRWQRRQGKQRRGERRKRTRPEVTTHAWRHSDRKAQLGNKTEQSLYIEDRDTSKKARTWSRVKQRTCDVARKSLRSWIRKTLACNKNSSSYTGGRTRKWQAIWTNAVAINYSTFGTCPWGLNQVMFSPGYVHYIPNDVITGKICVWPL